MAETPKAPKYLYDAAYKFERQGQEPRTHYVRAWAEGKGRNKEIVVQVWLDKDTPEGEPKGDWAMPGVLSVTAAIAQAVVQTQ